STRLHVETIAPSATTESAMRRRSAGSSRPFVNATRSRTSTGAVRWLRPTRTIPRSTSEGLAVLPQLEHVHADERHDDHGEPRDRERRGAPPPPPGRHPALEEDDVDEPRDEREPELGVGRPEPLPPRRVRPHDAAHDPEREQHEPPDETGVVEAVERLERRQQAQPADGVP